MSTALTELADLLRCPVSGQRLRIADPQEVAPIAERVSPDVAGFLIREDGRAVFPVKDGIPDLLPESLIPLDPASGS
jgi:uncharacterized protein YbaR (Trm112 family)